MKLVSLTSKMYISSFLFTYFLVLVPTTWWCVTETFRGGISALWWIQVLFLFLDKKRKTKGHLRSIHVAPTNLSIKISQSKDFRVIASDHKAWLLILRACSNFADSLCYRLTSLILGQYFDKHVNYWSIKYISIIKDVLMYKIYRW